MTYDIEKMRDELTRQVSPRLTDSPTGERIAESFRTIERYRALVTEAAPSNCLIPFKGENFRSILLCGGPAINSHVIQEKVLKRIATERKTSTEVLDFLQSRFQSILEKSKGATGKLWEIKPWEIEPVPPQPLPIASASARRIACQPCDSKTFRAIENCHIPWPAWPNTTAIHERRSPLAQEEFSYQLFLFAYRALLNTVSQFRGLIRSQEHRSGNEGNTSKRVQHFINTRQRWNNRVLGALTDTKAKYDNRLVGISKLPMIHHIVPVRPAFPMASAAFTLIQRSYVSTTVYPLENSEDSTTNQPHHWLIMSTTSKNAKATQGFIQSQIRRAQPTLKSYEASIRWTTQHLSSAKELSTYGNPEAYDQFRKLHPHAARIIERQMADTIVVEYYEQFLVLQSRMR